MRMIANDVLMVTKCGALTRKQLNSEYIRKLTNFDYIRYEDISDNENLINLNKRDVLSLLKDIQNQVYISKNVAYWKNTDKEVPDDIAILMAYMEVEIDGQFINLKKQLEQREATVAHELEKMREEQMNKPYSDEEMFEMRAAFGEGATVVNILTGEKVKL